MRFSTPRPNPTHNDPQPPSLPPSPDRIIFCDRLSRLSRLLGFCRCVCPVCLPICLTVLSVTTVLWFLFLFYLPLLSPSLPHSFLLCVCVFLSPPLPPSSPFLSRPFSLLSSSPSATCRQIGVPNLDRGERAEGAHERPRPPHPGDGPRLRLDRVGVRAHQALESEDAGGPIASTTSFFFVPVSEDNGDDGDDDYCSRRRGSIAAEEALLIDARHLFFGCFVFCGGKAWLFV